MEFHYKIKAFERGRGGIKTTATTNRTTVVTAVTTANMPLTQKTETKH